MPEPTAPAAPAAPAAAPAAPTAPPPAPDRAAARAAGKERALKKMTEGASPAAPAAPAAPEKPAPAAAAPVAPAAPAAPPKPKTEFERLVEEARRLSGPAPKPTPAAPPTAAPPTAAPATEPTAAQKLSIYRIAAEQGLDKLDLLRHFTAEIKADRALPFAGQPVFDPNRQKLTEVDENYAALRKELDELKTQNTELRQTWEQQQQAQSLAVKSANAVAHLQTDAKRWPVLTRNPNKEAVGNAIIEIVDAAAKYDETRGLTVSEVIDRLEKFEAAKLDPYKDLFAAPAAPAAPLNPQSAAKTVGEQTTIAPGSLAPQGGEPPARRATMEERKARAVEFLRSGKK
jgi:hypothetical protein